MVAAYSTRAEGVDDDPFHALQAYATEDLCLWEGTSHDRRWGFGSSTRSTSTYHTTSTTATVVWQHAAQKLPNLLGIDGLWTVVATTHCWRHGLVLRTTGWLYMATWPSSRLGSMAPTGQPTAEPMEEIAEESPPTRSLATYCALQCGQISPQSLWHIDTSWCPSTIHRARRGRKCALLFHMSTYICHTPILGSTFLQTTQPY